MLPPHTSVTGTCAEGDDGLVFAGAHPFEVVTDEIDLDQEPRRRLEMIEKSGRHTVPQIFIDGTHVGGSDDLAAAESSGMLDRLLAGSGA